ncbi:hypothetical protein Halru_0293 [Halovivax ruber XH-70]|uniref:DUF7350 domain-containing protein n=1 Tax=Halovivax ruber (strain DSM 18193 / JCM 13892 / XH-70) TaxID=797302 RepID=L0I8B4_HALRX|nr:hypothetical protein [Halovivax ruber]AGB14939.1 hypothetical protein Halru_0293 [Halovivax ruber XH-70]
MERREFVGAGACLSSALAAGCMESVTSLLQSEDRPREPPVVDDRPDAVYVPTHTEGMEMAGMARAGPYAVALSYSFPHRFWTVSGDEAERVFVQDPGSAHLMLTVWDPVTDVVVPVGSPTIELTRGGDVVDQRVLWPMLSQTMGAHFGDNVPFPDDGTYTATIRLDPLTIRRTGDFADQFDEPATVEITFDYTRDARDGVTVREYPDEQGQKGVAPPTTMDGPATTVPPEKRLPGAVLGDATSGDARFVATVVDDGDRLGADGTAESYLAVSPRTPYNHFPLPFMAVSATITRNEETVVADEPLRATLDPDLAFHYGTAVEGVEAGDTVTLSIDTPPQVARHEGYETAFLTMADVEFTV